MATAFRAVRVVTTAVAFEQFDGVVDDVLDVGGVPHCEGGQLLERHPLVHEGASGDEHVDGIGGEALVVALADRFNFETYNLGHLITAAVRHYEVTGSETLLNAAKNAAKPPKTTIHK